jgi:uncharacterized membrane protein YeaQ/YmgE (transglycosylase-associated protein family)
MIHIIWSIIVGFIIGWLAKLFIPGAGHLGFWMTAGLGIAGSFVGGLIGMAISKPQPGSKFHPAGFFMSVICAALLLYLYTKFGA